MADNVLNNGAGENAQKEENKKEQERPAARTSLKARLAEKKALVSGQGKDREAQENAKKNQAHYLKSYFFTVPKVRFEMYSVDCFFRVFLNRYTKKM